MQNSLHCMLKTPTLGCMEEAVWYVRQGTWNSGSLLNRRRVTSEVKKAVDDTLDFLETVVKGHLLAAACKILGISSLDEKFSLPSTVLKANEKEQLRYIYEISTKVVHQCTLIDTNVESSDHIYNVTMVLLF